MENFRALAPDKNWNFDFLARLCHGGAIKGACVCTKRKSPQILSLIPMKSLTVWRGHSTRPSLSAGTARKASGHLSGRRLLHLANARPFGRLKAPLGLSLLRCAAQTRACLWQAEQAHHANNEKQEVPTCWVFVKQFSRNDTATACQDWLRVPG